LSFEVPDTTECYARRTPLLYTYKSTPLLMDWGEENRDLHGSRTHSLIHANTNMMT